MSEASVTSVGGAAGSGDAESEAVERARGLEGLVKEHAAAGEERGELAEEVVQALHDTNLWGIWVPASLGGGELYPVASLQVIEALSYADASTGWVLMAGALATGTGAAYLADEAVDQIFADGRIPVIEGQGTRPGKAVPTEGGYLLSGSWSFASGIKHAEYIHTGSAVEGTGEPRICVLPVGEGTLIDNWDVLGLRATGSIDYTIDSVFVPEAYTHYAVTETPLRGGNVFSLGIVNLGMICHSGWALGVGRRMLDELLALVASKSGRPGAVVDSDAFQGDYARAEAKYRAAHALVYETWHDVEDTLRRGDALSQHQNTLTRLALNHTTWAVEEVSMFVYTAAATTGLRAGTIQRFFRDMHAGTQHVTSSPPPLQACGRQLLGVAQGQRWQFLSLVDAA